MTAAERLSLAIHMESAAIAPQTSELIEAAKEVLRENERLRFALRTVLGDADHGQKETWKERCLIGREALNAYQQNTPCETCGDDPVKCSEVPGLRHCEKANRGQ